MGFTTRLTMLLAVLALQACIAANPDFPKGRYEFTQISKNGFCKYLVLVKSEGKNSFHEKELNSCHDPAVAEFIYDVPADKLAWLLTETDRYGRYVTIEVHLHDREDVGGGTFHSGKTTQTITPLGN